MGIYEEIELNELATHEYIRSRNSERSNTCGRVYRVDLRRRRGWFEQRWGGAGGVQWMLNKELK